MRSTNSQDKQLVEKYRGMTPEQRKQFRANQSWKQNATDAAAVEQDLQEIDQGK